MDVPLHFQKGQKPKPSSASTKGTDDISAAISDVGGRLRVLEERYLNLRRKMQVTDQNLIETEKAHMKEVKELNNCVLDLKHNLSDVSEKITVMLGEMTNCVKSGEFLAIKKYIELWQPERFVTKKEVEDIMDTSKSNHNTLQ